MRYLQKYISSVLKFTFTMVNLDTFCSGNSVDLYQFAAGKDNSNIVFYSAFKINTNVLTSMSFCIHYW